MNLFDEQDYFSVDAIDGEIANHPSLVFSLAFSIINTSDVEVTYIRVNGRTTLERNVFQNIVSF